jgi:hypothetical protein
MSQMNADLKKKPINESHQSPIIGLKWKVVINGKKALNGNPYSVTFRGDVAHADPDSTIFDVARALAGHVQNDNEMEFVHSMQLTIST